MVGRLQGVEMSMQLEEDVLRELFGRRAILKEVEGDAEHHGLVPPDQGLELDCDVDGVSGVSGGGGECSPHPSRDIYEKDGAADAGLRAEG